MIKSIVFLELGNLEARSECEPLPLNVGNGTQPGGVSIRNKLNLKLMRKKHSIK